MTDGISPDVRWAPDAAPETVAGFIAETLHGDQPKAIAVPGGSTPEPIFAELAQREDIAWNRVAVHLTDDRCVEETHEASNFGLLNHWLGKTQAALARLIEGEEPPPFDLVWLGMGEDGHVASLFPNADPGLEGRPGVLRLTPDPLPASAPFDRLSMNLAALVRTDAMMLVLKGAKKRQVLEAAIAGENDLPIARLLHAAPCPVTIFWSKT